MDSPVSEDLLGLLLEIGGRPGRTLPGPLPPLLAVAATDVFFQGRLARDLERDELRGRPKSWNKLAREIADRSLVDMLGNPQYSLRLHQAPKVRNELAHGGDPKEPLSEVSTDLAEREARWEEQEEYRVDFPLAPSGAFVLSETLAAVRAVRRETRSDTRSVFPMGMLPV